MVGSFGALAELQDDRGASLMVMDRCNCHDWPMQAHEAEYRGENHPTQ
jgi:hypothetical protein